MLTIRAGVATWEREIMLERQREGIAKAKAAGKYKGRPISIDAAQIRQLRAELGPAAIREASRYCPEFGLPSRSCRVLTAQVVHEGGRGRLSVGRFSAAANI